MTFAEDLAAAKAAGRRTLDVPVTINETRYKFRFSQMDGAEYAAETLRHAPDFSVPLHRQYGYDLNSLSRAVTPRCAVLLDGDNEVPLSAEEWADLFAVADGGAQEEIANTVFTLNEFATARAVELAKKVLDGSVLNSASPSD